MAGVDTTHHRAHTDKYNVTYYQNNEGKYVVGQSVNNGAMGAGMKVFDTAAEANAYLEKIGVEETLFAPDTGTKKPTAKADDDSFFKSSKYSRSIGKANGFATKFSLLNILSGGKYSEAVEQATEHASRYTGASVLSNAIEKSEENPLYKSSGYSQTIGKVAGAASKFSLMNLLTGGKFSENVEQGVEHLSRFSPNNVLTNLLA